MHLSDATRIIDQDKLDQDTDSEIDRDYETGTLLARERAAPGKTNAVDRREYYARARPQRNLMSREGHIVEAGPGEPYDRGDDKYDPGVKAAQTYRPSARVSNDLVAEGHGFTTARFSNPDRPQVCRYCGDRLLPPDDTSVCEFGSVPELPGFRRQDVPNVEGVRIVYRNLDSVVPVKTRDRQPITLGDVRRSLASRPVSPPSFAAGAACRCNGCVTAREGRRKAGGQEVACYSPECRQKLAVDQREANRRTEAKRRERINERQRASAVPLLLADPDRSDREIAAELTRTAGHNVPIVRVREARKSMGTNP